MIGNQSILFDFDTLAAEYDNWYETVEGKAYDRQQKSAVRKLLPPAEPGDSLLDIGCGTGHWSRLFASLGYRVFGVDISTEMIGVARSHDCSKMRFGITDACCLPFRDASFDVVAAMVALEFVSNLEPAVSEMFRCVKSGGSVIVGALNRLAPLNLRRLNEGKEPYASAHLFSPHELRRLLAPYGRLRMRVTERGPEQILTRPFRVVREYLSLRWGKPRGVFIVVEVF